MMQAWALGALLSLVLAAFFAAADGAMLSAGTATLRRVSADPERTHRALSFARLLAHLVTGTGIALVVSDGADHPNRAIVAGVLLLIVNVMLVEGIARSAGFVGGQAMVERLAVDCQARGQPAAPGHRVERGSWSAPSRAPSRRPTRPTPRGRSARSNSARSSPPRRTCRPRKRNCCTASSRSATPRCRRSWCRASTSWGSTGRRRGPRCWIACAAPSTRGFPVFDETLDNVVGILYAKDLLPTVVAEEEPPRMDHADASGDLHPAHQDHRPAAARLQGAAHAHRDRRRRVRRHGGARHDRRHPRGDRRRHPRRVRRRGAADRAGRAGALLGLGRRVARRPLGIARRRLRARGRHHRRRARLRRLRARAESRAKRADAGLQRRRRARAATAHRARVLRAADRGDAPEAR